MLLFNERVAIADKFREWAKERFALECPENVLAFLSEKDALKEDLIEGICLELGFSEEEQNPQVFALTELCRQLKKKQNDSTIEKAPPDDLKIVKCKDCRFFSIDCTGGNWTCLCGNGLYRPEPATFCSYGEKKMEGEQ